MVKTERIPIEEFVSPGGTNGEKVIFASGLARRVVFCR